MSTREKKRGPEITKAVQWFQMAKWPLSLILAWTPKSVTDQSFAYTAVYALGVFDVEFISKAATDQ